MYWSIIGAFVEIPYAGLLLVLLGLIGGFAIAAEDHVRVLVSALVLTGLSGVLMNIPEVGQYLTAIFSAVGTFAAGASMAVLVTAFSLLTDSLRDALDPKLK